eukprot:TRINITY_DN8927_c0_g3_i2.p1 TRINITY_DN8927_c0_g3~~TRINITY_DN8927_c0_g3_i2.p1  ORF type:complete len:717 (+),score=68.77 TRINITY_DN8927_c0_g3_i2:83-2233(+)
MLLQLDLSLFSQFWWVMAFNTDKRKIQGDQDENSVLRHKKKHKVAKESERKTKQTSPTIADKVNKSQEGVDGSQEKAVKKKTPANIDLRKQLKKAGLLKKNKKEQGGGEVVNIAGFGKQDRKELLQQRKAKKNKNYFLLQELTKYWEEFRKSQQDKQKRLQLIDKTLKKAKGQIFALCRNHVASRIFQSAVVHGTQNHLNIVLEEVKDEIVNLSKDTYGHHVVRKIIAAARSQQVDGLVRLFIGNIPQLLRHPCGCTVIDDLYLVAKPQTRNQMLVEFYGKEYRLFGSAVTAGQSSTNPDDYQNDNKQSKFSSFEQIWAKAGEGERRNIIQSLNQHLSPIMEKLLLDPQITHKLLSLYVEHAPGSLVEEAIQNLCGEPLLRIVHTIEGAKTACMIVGYSTAKDRKKIVKCLKGHVLNMAKDSFGYTVLITILDKVDDTTFLNKTVIPEIVSNLLELCADKYGSRVILHLLFPYNTRHIPIAHIQNILSYPTKTVTKVVEQVESKDEDSQQKQDNQPQDMEIDEQASDSDESVEKEMEKIEMGVSKKQDVVRRTELLQGDKTQLLQKLFEECLSRTSEMITTRFSDFVIQELATGGKDGFLVPLDKERIEQLQDRICEVIDSELLDNYFGNRSIAYMIQLDGNDNKRQGASLQLLQKLWNNCFKGNCKELYGHHSQKVFAALYMMGDKTTKKEIKKELAGLVGGSFQEWISKFRFQI